MTVFDRQERIRHHLIVSKAAESVNANGLEELEVVDNEPLCEEETTLFDVEGVEAGERRQIHFLQLHTVSSPARDRQGLNQGWLIVHSGEGKCWLVVASRRSVSEHCRQRIRILRHQLSQDGEGSVAVD